MEKDLEKKAGRSKPSGDLPNFTRPVWKDQDKSCEHCDYNGQDIDTFPCAKCHTRH